MGEIGLNRREYLYELKYWELEAIREGYDRRSYHLWGGLRWHAFQNMMAFVGGDAMRENGINHPKDLLPLPWDEGEEQQDDFDEEYANEMLNLVDSVNKKKGAQ